MFKRIGIILACLGTVLLTGCLSTTTFVSNNEWSGRFSLIAYSDLHKENHSGRFSLMKLENDRLVLDLKTGLGNTLARVEYAPQESCIQAIGLKNTCNNDPEQLMNDLMGFSVPIKGLAFWIDGNALPDVDGTTSPNTQPYECIEQLGWKMTYRQYDEAGFPRRIVFEREKSERSPALKITLIILERRHGTT